jgi:hypothetical protein
VFIKRQLFGVVENKEKLKEKIARKYCSSDEKANIQIFFVILYYNNQIDLNPGNVKNRLFSTLLKDENGEKVS